MPAGQKTSGLKKKKKKEKKGQRPSQLTAKFVKLSVTLSSLIITFAFTSDILGFQMLCSVPFRDLLKIVLIIITKSGARLTEFLVKPPSGLLLRPNSQLCVAGGWMIPSSFPSTCAACNHKGSLEIFDQ